MVNSYTEEPLIKEYDLDDGTHVELRDASSDIEDRRKYFDNSIAGFMKRNITQVREDETNFPDYPKGATRHWIYNKNGKILSVLEVQDMMGWNFEIYPFDNCVELENDPNHTGIERYNTEEETYKAVLTLLKKM